MAHETPARLNLGQLLSGLTMAESPSFVFNSETAALTVEGLALDSRSIRPGDLFFACSGEHVNGLDYAEQVEARGAVAVVYDAADRDWAEALGLTIPCLPVVDLAANMGVIASRFHGYPSRYQQVIGVTGTNGKTSFSHFLAQIIARLEGSCGLVGTLGYGLYGHLSQGQHTTPDTLRLQAELAEMYAAGARHVAMEVSSHGLDQGRVAGVEFDVAVLTNLSHDHLDYHQSFAGYAAAKRRLFEVSGLRTAVINRDDEFGRQLIGQLVPEIQVLSYAIEHTADVQAEMQHMDQQGFVLAVTTPWGKADIHSRLMGRFNASNLLAVLATLLVMDVPFEQAVAGIEHVTPVRGRMERFAGKRNQAVAIVDYAHTPDALKQVLLTLRAHCQGELWCVFGCGGNRDRSKRALMGAIAEHAADHVVVTDDNPRHEASADIIEDILSGFTQPAQAVVRPDRAAAIRYALTTAKNDDVVLVAGKGHEDYQLVGDQILPFSDRQCVADILGEAA